MAGNRAIGLLRSQVNKLEKSMELSFKMNSFTKYILASFIFLFSVFAFAETLKVDESKIISFQSEISTLKAQLTENQNDLDKIRNDQINYKIEKDLLKEVYSSSLSTVNTVVSVVFALITLLIALLGYLGLRNIREIQAEYKKELENVKAVKNSFDNELNNFKSKQAEFESEFTRISKTNEDQNQRLKTLELIEKISNLVQTKNYSWAQTHIAIGLESDPKNLYLLQFKATCHGRMGEFPAFIDANKKLLALENNEAIKPNTAMNLLEGYAITNQKDEFNSLYSIYKDSIIKEENGSVNAYLRALMNTSSGNIEEAITILKTYSEQDTNMPPHKHLGLWSFDEVSIFLNSLTDEKSKNLMFTSIRFFNGEIDSKKFIEELNLI